MKGVYEQDTQSWNTWRQQLLLTDLFCKELCVITKNHSKISKPTSATLSRHNNAMHFCEN